MSERGVLLLAHGTPDSLDQMEAYLAHVRAGRPPAPELVAAVKRRYAAIGGRSPLLAITRAQAQALRQALGGATPVHVGMRHWHPFIADTLESMAADGITEIVAIPLAPQYSTLSTDRYREAVDRGMPPGVRVRFVGDWHDHPLLIEAFAERMRAALLAHPSELVIFTAHSVPERVIREGDPYADQVRATACGVAARAGVADYEIAYQSAAGASEPWLGPALDARLRELARAGLRSALIAPVTFVYDHVEILYDIDIEARRIAQEEGLSLARTESLNASPTFIRALVDLVEKNG